MPFKRITFSFSWIIFYWGCYVFFSNGKLNAVKFVINCLSFNYTGKHHFISILLFWKNTHFDHQIKLIQLIIFAIKKDKKRTRKLICGIFIKIGFISLVIYLFFCCCFFALLFLNTKWFNNNIFFNYNEGVTSQQISNIEE